MKDFDSWNEHKKVIHGQNAGPFYHEREIWWCSLGVNVGNEQDGTGKNFDRPVIILRGLSAQTCVIIPLTASPEIHPLRPSIGMLEGKEAKALLSQIRVIDVKRLLKKIGYLEQGVFEKIRKNAKDLL